MRVAPRHVRCAPEVHVTTSRWPGTNPVPLLEYTYVWSTYSSKHSPAYLDFLLCKPGLSNPPEKALKGLQSFLPNRSINRDQDTSKLSSRRKGQYLKFPEIHNTHGKLLGRPPGLDFYPRSHGNPCGGDQRSLRLSPALFICAFTPHL